MENDATLTRKVILKNKNKLTNAEEYEKKAKLLNTGEDKLLNVFKIAHRNKSKSIYWHESDVDESPNSRQNSRQILSENKRMAPDDGVNSTPNKRRPRIKYESRVLFPPKSAENDIKTSNSNTHLNNQNTTPSQTGATTRNANREQSLLSEINDNIEMVELNFDSKENQEINFGVLNAIDSPCEGEEKLIFQKYFKIIGTSTGKNVLASYNECGENKRGSTIATTNFKRHLKVSFPKFSYNEKSSNFCLPVCPSSNPQRIRR